METKNNITDKNIPYIVFESALARFDRVIKRLWIIILVLIFLLLGTNLAWLYYESQFETVSQTTQTIEQKADGDSNNSFVGGDNNVSDTESNDNKEED